MINLFRREMRKIILSLLFAVIGGKARAQIVPIIPESVACSVVSVSSTIPTPMLSTSTVDFALPEYISIQNTDATNSIFCSQNSAVSTTTGWKIGIGIVKDWTLEQTMQWYCIASTAAVNADVCQTK